MRDARSVTVEEQTAHRPDPTTPTASPMTRTLLGALPLAALLAVAACAPTAPRATMQRTVALPAPTPAPNTRVGLGAGLFDAEEAIWNLTKLSSTAPPQAFVGETNSDLAFSGTYAIQGNYNGIMVWDLANPSAPQLVTEYVCPASQSDVSVYENLMFVSGEGLGGRLDCGTQGNDARVSPDRLRGVRIFDISDIRDPQYIANVQTCRGSHTHSVLKDPNDDENVYVYVSGSAPVRPAEELAGCSGAAPDEDPATALFRIEVIKVPLAAPQTAAIVSSPRIFDNLEAPPTHGLAPADQAEIDAARAEGRFVVYFFGQDRILPEGMISPMLAGVVAERGGTVATAADSTALRDRLPAMLAERFGDPGAVERTGPDQCHDITLYPAIGLAGGACEGYGLLLDISNPAMPRRLDAVADSNFAYWHSATFNNDGSKVLFTDEWGGGGQPKCRADDPYEWGANAIFTLAGGKMDFQSYYKMPGVQTELENCVAHNGSLIPIPGRDVMVQAWYQGGISVFDWTDASNPMEIAFHDRGPVSGEGFQMGGSWSVYWYNGQIVSSEIARGLDVFELTPSGYLSQNEIDAAKSVRLGYLNAQGQPKYEWPATFALAGAFLDQIQRAGAMPMDRIASTRGALAAAEAMSGTARRTALTALASDVSGMAAQSSDPAKARMLADAVRRLATS